VVVAGVLGLSYRRQIVSYVSHRKGGPSTTWPYVPHEPAPEFHLVAAGDVGDGGGRIEATGAAAARIAAEEPYDALLLLGDQVYPHGDPARLPATVFGPFAAVLEGGAELLAILGNHDVMDGHGDDQLAELGVEGRWWSRTYGDVLVVGLDSTDLEAPGQLEFLESTLSATEATWRIVAIHHPPYSAGYQGSSIDVRETLAPILARDGVQLVLSGHDHDYQRSVPIDGTTYVVSGAGSSTRRTGEDDFTAASWSWHHIVDIAVTGDVLTLRAVGQDGSVFDELVLRAV
jgi:3',5'-cyclic AMP phosphodiesterase CpdA